MQPADDATEGRRLALASAMAEACRTVAAAEAAEATARARLAEHANAAPNAVIDRLQRIALEAAVAGAAWHAQLARESSMLAQAAWLASNDPDPKLHLLVLQQVQDLRREFSERLAGIETTKAQLRGLARWLDGRGNFVAARLAVEAQGAIDPEVQAQMAAIEAAAAEFAGA